MHNAQRTIHSQSCLLNESQTITSQKKTHLKNTGTEWLKIPLKISLMKLDSQQRALQQWHSVCILQSCRPDAERLMALT